MSSSRNKGKQKHISTPEQGRNKFLAKLNEWQTIIEILGAVGIIVTFLISNNNLSIKYDNLLESNEKYQQEINTKVEGYEHNIQEYNRRWGEFSELKGKFSEIEAMAIEKAIAIYPTNETKDVLKASFNKIRYEDNSDDAIFIGDDEVIASDQDGNHKFTVESIAGAKVIMPYIQDGKETFFCGQFNNRLHWNGDCIINQYDNQKLVYVCEAVYLDGELMSYEQAYFDSKENLWRITNRYKEDDNYNGYAYEYTGIDVIEQAISFDNAKGSESNFDGYV